MKSPLSRIVIYPKDVQRITGKSERYGRSLLQKIRAIHSKSKNQYVSIPEFCEFTGLPEELIRKYILD